MEQCILECMRQEELTEFRYSAYLELLMQKDELRNFFLCYIILENG